jgi:hypothetical protein
MLADSTSIKFLGEGEWKTKKYGAERRRQWRKVKGCNGVGLETVQRHGKAGVCDDGNTGCDEDTPHKRADNV